MLHEQARVNSHEDAGTEPAKESKNLSGSITVFKTGFLRKSSGSGFSYGGNDSRSRIEYKDPVGQ